MRTEVFCKSLLPLQCPVTAAGGNRGGAPKPPWPLWGCLGTAEAGGFRRQSLRNFLPIPSSLFSKKPSPFHMGLYFQKVPTVNPSVKNQRFLPAPFGKGAFGVHRRSPPGHCGGGFASGKTGGILQAGRFPHGFVLWESANCESLSQKSKIFASSHRPGAFAGSDRGQFRTAAFYESLLP